MARNDQSCTLELETLRPSGPPRPWGWCLRYAGHACGAARDTLVHELTVDGVAPEQLLHIDISAQDRLLFSLHSVLDRGGRLSTAGQMLHAMATYSGRRGLSIAALELGPPTLLDDLVVHLQLQADQRSPPVGVSVQAHVA